MKDPDINPSTCRCAADDPDFCKPLGMTADPTLPTLMPNGARELMPDGVSEWCDQTITTLHRELEEANILANNQKDLKEKWKSRAEKAERELEDFRNILQAATARHLQSDEARQREPKPIRWLVELPMTDEEHEAFEDFLKGLAHDRP